MADAVVESAPGDENDDNWLYGESGGETNEATTNGKSVETQKQQDGAEAEDKEQEDADDSHFNDEHFAEVTREETANGDAENQENGESDSDDSDDIKVTIGEIKSGPQYANLNIKRGLVGPGDKPRQIPVTGSKVTLEDLEGPGTINGVPALEYSIDTIEDKPWNKPGADISDYFNYGFTESTWSAYCERQRRMRVNEAGVGLQGIHSLPPPRHGPPPRQQNEPIVPPGVQNNFPARENTIQVMTAERREYGGRGMHAPQEYFPPPALDYYATQPLPYENQWGHTEPPPGWAPTEIKELTPGPGPIGPPAMGHPAPQHIGVPPHIVGAPPTHIIGGPTYPSPYRPPHFDRDRDRERERRSEIRERDDRDRRSEMRDDRRSEMRERDERDRRSEMRERDERDRYRREEEDRERERSRSVRPDRIREKSYRRERSRSRERSRRHKSRSRSPRIRERSRERERSPRERERSRERGRTPERPRDRERSVKPKSKETKEKKEEP